MQQGGYWWKLLHTTDFKGVLAGFAAHSGQISVGLSQGFSAILIPKLLESNFASINEASWIASLGVISNPLGAFIAGTTAECYGRRAAIALATLPHAMGWLLIALAQNVPVLYAGRLVSGIGTGMANALYLYVTEAAAPHQRAWLASSGPVLVSLGVLGIYALGAITSWQSSAAISIGPAILSLALTRIMPESPAWLIRKNRLKEAQEALIWLRGPGLASEKEFQQLCSSSPQDTPKKSLSFLQTLSVIWKPFIILIIFFGLQQMSGIYIILFYAVTFLKEIGTDINEYAASVGIGVIRLSAAILGTAVANHFGRKALACSSAIGMAFAAGGVAIALKYPGIPSCIPLICVAFHVAFSMIGFLTLPWVMTSELYSLKYRGTMSGITTAIAQIMAFATIKSYPHVNNIIGLEGTMYIFTVSAIVGALFAGTILPETKGKSLDEIGKDFTTSVQDNTVSNLSNERFSVLPEDKYTYPRIIVLSGGYDNLGIDLRDEQSSKSSNSQVFTSDSCILKLSSLEHGRL